MASKSAWASLTRSSWADGAVFRAVGGISDFVPGAAGILSSKLPPNVDQRAPPDRGSLEDHAGRVLEDIVGAIQGGQGIQLYRGPQVLGQRDRREDPGTERQPRDIFGKSCHGAVPGRGGSA